MQWIIYAFGSAAFAALVAIFGKIGLTGIDSTLATTVRSVVMAVFLILVSLSLGKFGGLGEFSNKTYLFIILSGLAGALSWLCYFLALKYGPVSGVVALDRTSIAMAIVLAALFLGETLSWKTALGGAMVVAGALIVAL